MFCCFEDVIRADRCWLLSAVTHLAEAPRPVTSAAPVDRSPTDKTTRAAVTDMSSYLSLDLQVFMRG